MKEKILEATLDLAVEKGLGRISMSQIAERVGLKKSSLYSHYKSKDEIIDCMYTYFRNKAKGNSSGEIDYGKLVEGRSFKEVLYMVVNSYRTMTNEEDLSKFYRLMESEHAINPSAAHIMVEETNTMINATKTLFYALQAKNIVAFDDPDGAAFSFCMGIHAVLVFENDAKTADMTDANGAMDRYIDEFSRVYDRK